MSVLPRNYIYYKNAIKGQNIEFLKKLYKKKKPAHTVCGDEYEKHKTYAHFFPWSTGIIYLCMDWWKTVFVIREEDGYLNVYFGEEDALYMYTGIAYQGLPEELKKEISNGKTFDTLEDLYRFLESYSS